jgi:DNA ligase 4
MSDRPDVYIRDVSKSVVLEIRAGELQVSDQYPTMYTLRFPRVLKIRYDKNWDEAFTDAELKELVANFQQNRRLKRKDNLLLAEGEEENEEPQRKRKKKPNNLLAVPGQEEGGS